jgi:hypothetical protein
MTRALNTLQMNKNNSTITFTNSSSFFTTTVSVSLTNLAVLLPQSHDCIRYIVRPILAPPPLWMHKHTDLRANNFTHTPTLWHQPSSLILAASEAEEFVELILLYSWLQHLQYWLVHFEKCPKIVSCWLIIILCECVYFTCYAAWDFRHRKFKAVITKHIHTIKMFR